MTEPINVGGVSIDVVADLRKFMKNMREDVEKSFKDLRLDKVIQDQVKNTKVKVPLSTDTDTSEIGDKVKKTRTPKVAVPLDPLLAAFQQEVRRQTAALARTANANIPVGADTSRLRTELGAALAAVKAQTRIEVPTDPEGRGTYEAKLRAQLAEVAARVRQTVKVNVDVDAGRSGGVGSFLSGLSRAFTSALPGLSRLGDGVTGLIGNFQRLAGTSAQAGGSMVGAVTTATGPVGALVGSLLAAAAAATAFTTGIALAVPVLGAIAAAAVAAAGAVAAIPAALSGVAAGFGTLSLGFRGITDAFKPRTGGSGGGGAGEDAASRARRIAAAERGVESARRGIAAATRGLQAAERGYDDAVRRVAEAQDRARRAQEAVNRARREAVEDIDDLGRALRGAVLDEEDAALRVTDALRELDRVKKTGVLPDIQRADREYRQAQLALENARDTTEDLGEASAEANAKGVEGSDKVQAALRDQAEALQGVKDAQDGVLDARDALASANDSLKASYDGLTSAQDALAEAQKKAASAGGGGGALGEVIKLAPAAQRFVDAVKALKPAFEDLRLDVQQRLFRGLDRTVTNLGRAWIPALKTTLGSYADTFNGFFRTLGANLATPRFIADIQTGAEGARQGLEAIGRAVSGPLVRAFGTLSAAAAPFLQTLGAQVASVVTDFSRWIEAANRTGRLQSFFETAGEALKDMFVTGRQTVRLVANIISILAGGNGRDDKSAVDSFNDGLRSINEWLEDPANRQRIAAFAESLKDMFRTFASVASATKGLLDRIFPPGSETSAGSLGAAIGNALVAGLVAGMVNTMAASSRYFADLFLNGPFSLVGGIKRLLGINSPSTVMMAVGADVVAGLVAGISQAVPALLARAAELRDELVGAVGNLGRLLVGAGRQAVTGLINGVSGMVATLRARTAQLRTTVVTAVANSAGWLLGVGRNVVAGLVNGVRGSYTVARAAVGNLRAYVINAVASSGNWLLGVGRNVVYGLWNGIASLGGWLYNRVASFARQQVRNAFQNALGIASPSKVTMALGREVTAGLAVGMLEDARRVEQAAASLASAATPGLASADLGAEFDARVQRSLSVASQQQLVASWAQGSTADPLLAWLQSTIKFRYRGDPIAALSSG